MKNKTEDLAIVGIGCRYPGNVSNPHELWELLLSGKDGFKTVPEGRWSLSRHMDKAKNAQGKMFTEEAAFIDDAYMFEYDADFFNFSTREAGSVDPQQRLLHEVCWECFEDTRIPAEKLNGQEVGVYVGAFTCDNLLIRSSPESFNLADQFSATSSTFTMLANRLSYFFNFHGPSLTIDTACSSSLVALNYACQDLWSGVTQGAVVAGVNAILYPSNATVMSTGGFLSPDCRSQAFDIKANGYARGEGAGAVYIKRLSDAEKDGDDVYAVIKGAALNQDGRTVGIAAPNGEAQQRLIQQVINDFDVDTENIVLVEAHGTGTSLGDPTEISALSNALGKRRDNGQRLISSIKGNIGHQEGGAGIAGVIKAALALKHNCAPKQSNFSELNPALDLESGGFSVLTETTDLPKTSGQPLACVNSFGYGGTNAHAILGQWTKTKTKTKTKSNPTNNTSVLIALSANDPKALIQRIHDVKILLDKNIDLSVSELSHALLSQADSFDFRLAFAAKDRAKAISILNDILSEENEADSVEEGIAPSNNQGIVFVYTGMGPQWWAMGRELYENSPIFKQALVEADQAFQKHSGWSILDEMLKDQDSSDIAKNEIAQPANFILQYAITQLLDYMGLTPDAIIGHSVGEVGASLASGALILEDAALVAYHRSRLQQTKAGQGRMLATGLDFDTAQEIIGLYEGRVSIGAINSSSSIALSGDLESLETIRSQLEESNIFAKLIFGEVAYHSHQMDELEDEVLSSLRTIKPKKPTIPLYSTVTGAQIIEPTHCATYWWKNVRQSVEFHEAMQVVLKQGYRNFIEIGPNPVLSGAIQQICAELKMDNSVIVSSLIRKTEEEKSLLQSLARLWCNGISLKPMQNTQSNGVSLPHYPWQRTFHWTETKALKNFRLGKAPHPLSGVKQFSAIPSWEKDLDGHTRTVLQDHVINTRPIFPAAGYIETFLDIAAQTVTTKSYSLSDISFDALLALPKDDSLYVRTTLNDNQLTLFARTYRGDGDWKAYASAKLLQREKTIDAVDITKYISPFEGKKLRRTEIYRGLDNAGLSYGPAFQVIDYAVCSEGFVQAQLSLPKDAPILSYAHVQPSIMDGALQLLALSSPNNSQTALPVSIAQFSLFSKEIPDQVLAYVRETRKSAYFTQADVVLCDTDNNPLMVLNGVKAQTIAKGSNDIGKSATAQYQMVWRTRHIDTPEKPINTVAIKGANSPLKNKISVLFNDTPETQSNHYTIWVADQRDTISPDATLAIELTRLGVELGQSNEEATLVVCTQNRWRIRSSDICDPAHADLWGVARSLRREIANLSVICIDFGNSDLDIQALPHYLPSLQDGGEFAFRDGEMWQHYLVDVFEEKNENVITVPYKDNKGLFLETGERGGIDSLQYRTHYRRAPQSDEIEVKIDHISLNFKDVLKVFNRLTAQTLDGTFTGDSLGMEAHATIVRKGPDSDLNIGEGIIFCAQHGAFKTYSTFSPSSTLVLRWDALDLGAAEKSTLPTAYSTAHYSLLHAGRLSEGETVLLHSATGGVGHAAIQVARYAKANIIATAGTEEKRDYLRQMGIEHVFDARSLNFEQQILDVTDTQGVDVVLNFLPDDYLHASIRLLKPFGRLVEIGKADIGQNKDLPLGQFERNLSFIAFDYDNLIKVNKPLAYRIAEEVYERIEAGDYDPKGIQTYPASKTKDCFRELAEGNHMGKRVINLTAVPEDILPPLGGMAPISEQATYLVTGAYGGVGLKTVEWLIYQGAKCIILCGRTIHDNETVQALKKLAEEPSCQLIEAACDVGNSRAVEKLLNKKYPYPVRGIFHTAAVLADAPADEQDKDHFNMAYYAKAMGAYNLHITSKDFELDYFVLFSSISATMGNHSQINYAGANCYLDALADYRRQQGLPGISIAWGAIGDVGMVARNEGVERVLTARGILPIPINEALSQMRDALDHKGENVGIFNIDWKKWGSIGILSKDEPAHMIVTQQQNKDDSARPLSNIVNVAESEGIELLQNFIIVELAKVLRRDPEKIRLDQSLSNVGLDSLMAVEFQLALEGELSGAVSPDVLDMQKSISAISLLIYASIMETAKAEQEEASMQDQDDTSDINVDDLDDDEVDALLVELLDEDETDE